VPVRQLWECPSCHRTFAGRNQVHTCARLGDLDRHFEGSEPVVRETFEAILTAVRGLGPVEVLAEKTRIALHLRMSFAALMPRRSWLSGHFVLARRVDGPRFTRIDALSARNLVHHFRLTSPDQVDEEFTAWLAEAYQVGGQQHLLTRARRPGGR
jgi:Domain of unknown function (DUF5655)